MEFDLGGSKVGVSNRERGQNEAQELHANNKLEVLGRGRGCLG